MKIPIISDTHDDINATKKVLQILKSEGFDSLIHLGDFCSPFMIDLFSDFKVYSVMGNNDGDKVRLTRKMLEYNFDFDDVTLEFSLAGKSIALYHGTKEVITNSLVKSGDFDIVLSGHTHKRVVSNEGCLHINPGTLNKSLSKDNKASFVILDLNSLDVIEREL